MTTEPAILALENAAKAITEAAKALRESVPTPDLEVGDVLTVADLDVLPVGSKLKDRDGDSWTKLDVGWRYKGEVHGWSNAMAWKPLTFVSLPEPEPVPAPEPEPAYVPKVGDKVKILEGWAQGLTSSVVGHVGLIRHIDTFCNPPMIKVGDASYNARKVELIESAPVPEPTVTFPFAVTAYYGDRKVEVTKTYDGRAQLRVGPAGSSSALPAHAYLTPEMARELAAALLAAVGPA